MIQVGQVDIAHLESWYDSGRTRGNGSSDRQV